MKQFKLSTSFDNSDLQMIVQIIAQTLGAGSFITSYKALQLFNGD